MVSSAFFSLFYMEVLRVGSLNINGGKDRNKRAWVLEIIKQKRLNVVLLQETHSDQSAIVIGQPLVCLVY